MTKRKQNEYTGRKALQQSGWNVEKGDAVRFNHGSETNLHAHAKLAAALALRDLGYRIDTEVEGLDGRAQIDVLAYGLPERNTLAVELETSPTEETKQAKLEKYVLSNAVIDDMVLINVSNLPMDCVEMKAAIAEQL